MRFSNIVSFKGRSNRLEYFVHTLILGIPAGLFGGLTSVTPFALILGIPLFILLFAPAVKRCHDLGLIASWAIVWQVFVLGSLVGLSVSILAFAVLGIPALIFSLFLLFKQGVDGTNKYGEDPLIQLYTAEAKKDQKKKLRSKLSELESENEIAAMKARIAELESQKAKDD